jgi:hypothetical protein
VTILDILRSPEAQASLRSLAAAYGITPEQLDAVLKAILPALTARMERNTLSRGGIADLMSEMGRPEHARVLADPARVGSADAAVAGIGALDTVFGSKATSRNVAAQAALSSGVSQAIIQKLLPILASLVMAALAKGTQGGLGDILKRLPDLGGAAGGSTVPTRRRQAPEPENTPRSQSDGGLGDIFARIPGLPGSTGGSPLPIPGGAPQAPAFPGSTNSGPFGGGSPLPLPGDHIPGVNAPNAPYGEMPDVIRRGGRTVDGAPLGGAIRDIFGSLLGFQSKGVIGWLVRLIVLRWGWGFVQRILSRVLTGR